MSSHQRTGKSWSVPRCDDVEARDGRPIHREGGLHRPRLQWLTAKSCSQAIPGFDEETMAGPAAAGHRIGPNMRAAIEALSMTTALRTTSESRVITRLSSTAAILLPEACAMPRLLRRDERDPARAAERSANLWTAPMAFADGHRNRIYPTPDQVDLLRKPQLRSRGVQPCAS